MSESLPMAVGTSCDKLEITLFGCRGIVVLAQQDKSWMDNEAQAALRGYNVSWQTREGAPYSANDLARVSAGSAETIILMRPENGRVSHTISQCAATKLGNLHVIICLSDAAKGRHEMQSALGLHTPSYVRG